ncbi:MAG: 30S ribosomal protein S3ae [Methanomicrobia archaeon]|nr:30S ribosomal protein S3ae [Methanomicrobia archaeon]
MAKKTLKKKDPWKLKKWYSVYAPKIFGNQKIADIPATEPEQLIGRVIETTLRDLTGDFTKTHVKLFFKITDVKGESAYTELKKQELLRSYMRSQVRRNTTKVDRIMDVKTKDGRKARVQVTAITAKRVQQSREKEIRNILGNVIKQEASNKDIEQFVLELVLGKIASAAYREAKKIYPLKRVEISKTKIFA